MGRERGTDQADYRGRGARPNAGLPNHPRKARWSTSVKAGGLTEVADSGILNEDNTMRVHPFISGFLLLLFLNISFAGDAVNQFAAQTDAASPLPRKL